MISVSFSSRVRKPVVPLEDHHSTFSSVVISSLNLDAPSVRLPLLEESIPRNLGQMAARRPHLDRSVVLAPWIHLESTSGVKDGMDMMIGSRSSTCGGRRSDSCGCWDSGGTRSGGGSEGTTRVFVRGRGGVVYPKRIVIRGTCLRGDERRRVFETPRNRQLFFDRPCTPIFEQSSGVVKQHRFSHHSQ